MKTTDEIDVGLQLHNRIAELERENAVLRTKLEPARQKIWVLAYRNSMGDLLAEVFTDPNSPVLKLQQDEVGYENSVVIHASL
ncbi:MAG: hypothetical protein E6Q97_38705 [Desulfurellales bacterium]|nr:MAG: hypothetical protein E6Q97_38705 [Desulfurellales bacterium]